MNEATLTQAMQDLITKANDEADRLQEARHFEDYHLQISKARHMRYGYEDLLDNLFPGKPHHLSGY